MGIKPPNSETCFSQAYLQEKDGKLTDKQKHM